MAELFLAQDNTTQQLVVLKRILPYLAHEQEFVQMFLDEARIASMLHHENVVHVYELGNLEGSIYIAMEFVDGVDLRKVLQEEAKRNGAVPYGVAAFIAARLCAGLHYAHTARDLSGKPLKIIHRDVSPQNVMVAYDADVKLVDFGIAKAGAFEERSKPGVIKGKFLYLAPEQLSQEPVDHRADIFAVGTLLYEITTGKSPFQKPTTEAVIYAVRSEEPPPPYLVRPDFPRELARIISRCMMKDRERRYAFAADVQADLQRFLRLTVRTQASDVSQYISNLFGNEEERTVLHIPKSEVGEELAKLRAEAKAHLSVGRRMTPGATPAAPAPQPVTQPPPGRRATAAYAPAAGEPELTPIAPASAELVRRTVPTGPGPGADPGVERRSRVRLPPPVEDVPTGPPQPRHSRTSPPVPDEYLAADPGPTDAPRRPERRKTRLPPPPRAAPPVSQPPVDEPSDSGRNAPTELGEFALGELTALATDASIPRPDVDVTDAHDLRRVLPPEPATQGAGRVAPKARPSPKRPATARSAAAAWQERPELRRWGVIGAAGVLVLGALAVILFTGPEDGPPPEPTPLGQQAEAEARAGAPDPGEAERPEPAPSVAEKPSPAREPKVPSPTPAPAPGPSVASGAAAAAAARGGEVVDVRFEAPAGTVIAVDDQRFKPGDSYARAPGVLRYHFVCPGKKVQVHTQTELDAARKSQVLAIDCGRP